MDCSHGGRDAAASAVQAKQRGPPRASDQTEKTISHGAFGARRETAITLRWGVCGSDRAEF